MQINILVAFCLISSLTWELFFLHLEILCRLQLHVNLVEIISVLAVCLSYLCEVPRGGAHEKGPLSTFCHGSFNRILELQLLVPLVYWRCFSPRGEAASTGVPLFVDLWNHTFCLLRKVKVRTMPYYGRKGKNADSHSVWLQLFLVCINDKWQWDIAAAVFNWRLHFLLDHVESMGVDCITHTTKVTLFLFFCTSEKPSKTYFMLVM